MSVRRTGWIAALSLGLGLGLGLGAAAQSPASLLDRLPRVSGNGYAAALQAARARGDTADVLWLELFYGDAAAKAQAEAALAPNARGAATATGPEMAFLRFVSAYAQGQDQQMLEEALRLTELAPNDVATELAVRELSGQVEHQGQALLNAVPAIKRILAQPLSDPTTPYMLGRSLLAAVHAPGIDLPPQQAVTLAGRLEYWQLWGPFGDWQNLDFDQTFPIERAAAASYADGSATRQPQSYDSNGEAVRFPADWGGQGLDFAVTYVHVEAPTAVSLRFFSEASTLVEIDGTTVVDSDRRSSYVPATADAALELQAGWNRVVVKLGGEQNRDFDLMLRPTAGIAPSGSDAWIDAAAMPAGARLARAPKLLAPPTTLATWAQPRITGANPDPVALWVDGTWRMQDEDGEHARVELTRAAQLAPNAAPIWLALAETYGGLEDASQSWAAAQMETAAQRALKADPRALRAYDRLGHVYDSEGKPTQAAQQYAQCEGKGYADCDWSAFHLAAEQHWAPEAETALGHALAESGSDWNGIVSGLEFYTSMGEAAKLAQWEQVLRADPRASAALGAFELSQGKPAAAAPLLAAAAGFEPSSPEARRAYLEALELSGNTAQSETEAQKALADFPHDSGIAATADAIGLRRNLASGIAQLRQTDFDRDQFRNEADFLNGDRFWQPWYHSTAQVLADAPGAEQYPNANAILVLDQMVARINPDSSQDQYIHEIYRVLNAAGIAELGDQSIPAGSELLTVRTIKASGAFLLPEKIDNLSSISMPGLEAGDFIETEYVQHMSASDSIPGTIENRQFFIFGDSDQPSSTPDHYSDYVVMTPPGYPLLVDEERFPGQPTVTPLADGETAREWLMQKTRLLVTEPHMPPAENLEPLVWVSSQMSWDQISQYLADHLYSVRKTTPEMQAQADELIEGQKTDLDRANAIFNWVSANIQPDNNNNQRPQFLQPARQHFTDRSGDRLDTFLGLLSAAHVPFQLALTRSVTDDSSIKIPSLVQFSYPLVHVAGGSGPAGWYDLNNDFAQVDYVVPTVRGALALVAGGTGSAAFTHIPDYTSPLDGVVVTVTGTVAASGDATLHLALEFRGPNGAQVREALAGQPDSSLPQIYQQMLLDNYPNGAATGGHVENMTDTTKPLIIDIDATVPSFAHMDGSGAGAGWDIENLVGAVDLLQRYAPLPFREHPLVIPGSSFEQSHVTLTLPANFGQAALPPSAHVQNGFGSFSSSFSQKGDQIEFERTLALNANLIQPPQYQAFRGFGETVDNQDRIRLTGKLSSTPPAGTQN